MRRLGVLVLLAGFLASLASDVSAQEKSIKIKRRHDLSDEDLRKQLKDPVPELGFQQATSMLVYTPIESAKKLPQEKRPGFRPDFGFLQYEAWAKSINQKEQFTSLPWHPGQDAQLGLESAKRLQVLSVNLRRYMREAVPSRDDPRPNPDKLRTAMTGAQALEWDQPEAIPTLMQMLQTEDAPIRGLLVDVLAKINGKEAGAALAQRAVFDLSPKIREKAVLALADRPHKEFKQFLLEALRSPWTPAADHAAEAITALQLKEVLPDLVQLLKQPDPKLPFEGEVKGVKTPVVRELVRVNHLSNCCLCHALSASKDDLVRGRVPTPGQEMREPYYGETTGLFVRADITFLRQDFSLIQPVTTPGKWAGHQRYDYIVRTRKATPKEATLLQGSQASKKLGDAYPQRDAIMFALRELSGRDLGKLPENWLPLLNPIRETPKTKESR